MEKTNYIKLLEEHRNRIYSMALYSLRDADDAADITQETFLRLWRYDGELTDGQAKAWLMRVCHNLCIDQARRRKTVRTYFGVPDQEAVENLKCSDGEGNDPVAQLHQQQQQQALLNSMAILPAETRSIMMLHYFQDLKIQEIAGLLGLKASTIKVRLHRARNSLKRHLIENNQTSLSCKREIG
jgi:RNA polymerase sigma-70 factor, ECF subfamily